MLMVSQDDEFLLPILAPVSARLGDSQRPALLVVVSTPAGEEAKHILARLGPTRCVMVLSSAIPQAGRNRPGAPEGPSAKEDTVLVAADPAQAGIQIARRFWGKTNRVVVAEIDDPSGTILGAALAAHLSVPFMPVIRWDNGQRLGGALHDLGVKEVLLSASNAADGPAWEKTLGRPVKVLDAAAAQARLVEAVGASSVRNVIVARLPNQARSTDPSAWLACYLSLVRKAPVVLCGSANAWEAELRVKQLTGTLGVRPRSVTILADYNSIGVSVVRDPKLLGDYEVEIEPCSGPGEGFLQAAAFGVGRIPFGSTRDASMMLAHGLVRESRYASGIDKTPTRRKPLLIANPNTQYGPLPLAETIGRVMGEEFKNCGVAVDEYYSKLPDDQTVQKCASQAQLIVYQGHITDQRVFQESQDAPAPGNVPPGVPEAAGWVGPEAQTAHTAAHTQPSPPAGPGGATEELEDQPDPRAPAPPPGAQPGGPPQPPGPPAAPILKEDLEGFPLVVLQSCHSLEDRMARAIFASGGAGVIGSVTNIHSASGSAFMKAYFDSVLYRGATAGEAMRDARNYFLCLADLKAARGHKQQAKGRRAALSFRLWGDPEVVVLPGLASKVSLAPVSAERAGGDGIVLSVPRHRLPDSRTEKYDARVFPGSQVAGIVKRLKDKPQRRLMPSYFFRLAAPEGFARQGYKTLRREGDTGTRAVFLADPLERFVWVLYFPEKEKVRESFTLKFGK